MRLERQHNIVSKILYVVILLFFLYAFWFQNAVGAVSIAMLGLGMLILLFSFMDLRLSIEHYKFIFPILLFVGYAVITGIMLTNNRGITIRYAINIIEYLIPMFGIYTYVDGKLEKMKSILWGLTLSITLLAIWSILFGQETNTGAIAVGELNVNVESSFFTIAVISNIVLFGSKKTKLWMRIVLIASTLLCLKAQIDCASRRGFIVFIFLLVAGTFSYVQLIYRDKPIVKIMMFFMAIFLGFLCVNFVMDMLGESTLFARFTEKDSVGDLGRKMLQLKALELFKESPIFGQGLGAVESSAGLYSHSLYFELLACTGVVGFATLIILLLQNAIFFLRQSRIAKTKDKDLAFGARIFFLFVLSIFVGGYAVVYIYDMYFYIMLGLLASMEKISIDRLNAWRKSND